MCQPGWKYEEEIQKRNPLYPCAEPICDFHGASCLHGICEGPDICACEVGWDGYRCDKCVPKPGCLHGNCDNAYECNCMSGWTGELCQMRKDIFYFEKYQVLCNFFFNFQLNVIIALKGTVKLQMNACKIWITSPKGRLRATIFKSTEKTHLKMSHNNIRCNVSADLRMVARNRPLTSPLVRCCFVCLYIYHQASRISIQYNLVLSHTLVTLVTQKFCAITRFCAILQVVILKKQHDICRYIYGVLCFSDLKISM